MNSTAQQVIVTINAGLTQIGPTHSRRLPGGRFQLINEVRTYDHAGKLLSWYTWLGLVISYT